MNESFELLSGESPPMPVLGLQIADYKVINRGGYITCVRLAGPK